MPNPFRAYRQLERFLGNHPEPHDSFQPGREYSDSELLRGARLIATIIYDLWPERQIVAVERAKENRSGNI